LKAGKPGENRKLKVNPRGRFRGLLSNPKADSEGRGGVYGAKGRGGKKIERGIIQRVREIQQNGGGWRAKAGLGSEVHSTNVADVRKNDRRPGLTYDRKKRGRGLSLRENNERLGRVKEIKKRKGELVATQVNDYKETEEHQQSLLLLVRGQRSQSTRHKKNKEILRCEIAPGELRDRASRGFSRSDVSTIASHQTAEGC